MIDRDIIFYDFETGSREPEDTQPVQIAAVCIDVRNLRVRPDSHFESLMRPIIDDEEAIAAGVQPLQDEALGINGHTREALEEAPEPGQVWKNFAQYCKKYAKNPDSNWTYPYCSGYNNRGFDDIIVKRLCKAYGPWNDKRKCQNIFHPMGNIDILQEIIMMFNGRKINSKNSHSMDMLREFFGMSTEGAHDALVDVKQGSQILIALMKFWRHYEPKIDFKMR